MGQLTHGSLFDGFGGLRRGLEDAGIETIWRLELMDGTDIEKSDPRRYARPDVLSGGPPCKRTSQASAWNRSRTLATLWPEMLRFIKTLRPCWVLMEQPLGGRSVIIEAAQELQFLGYGCAGRVINSEHWVPQRRERWFLVGRLGWHGMAVWNHIYANRERNDRIERGSSQEERRADVQPQSQVFYGNCSHCVRDGIFARISARRIACVGAGNAVTQPVAEWIGRRIVAAEELRGQE